MTGPDERAFEADVAKATFRLGAAEGRWRLAEVSWPFVFIGISARDAREYILRFNCAGYPQAAAVGSALGPEDQPSARLRSVAARARRARSAQFFAPTGRTAPRLYLPCDRESFVGPRQLAARDAVEDRRPGDGIVQYLELVHELLQSRDYAAHVRAAA